MLDKIRDYLWSEACNNDVVAYKAYLVAAENGLRLIAAGDVDGAAKLIGGECCRLDNDFSAKLATVVSGDARSDEVVDLGTGIDTIVGSEDHVDCGVGTRRLVVCDCGFSVDSSGDCKCRGVGSRVDEGLSRSWSCEFDSTINGRSVGPVLDSGLNKPMLADNGGNRGPSTRGPNFLRNQANRQAKKRRKQSRRQEALRADVQEKSGFWNSCSESVRRELIESKAKMHIAENLRKAKESEHRVSDMDSPFNLVQKVVKIVEFAQKQAEKTNDSRIHGWAQTVATVSAESLANSVPSSVPSLSEIKDSSPSCVSPDPSLIAKIEELELENNGLRKDGEDLRKVIQCLEDESLELRVEKEIADTQVSQISSRVKATKKKVESKSGNVRTIENYANFPGLHLNKNLKFERFDPKIHTVMTRADVYREF